MASLLGNLTQFGKNYSRAINPVNAVSGAAYAISGGKVGSDITPNQSIVTGVRNYLPTGLGNTTTSNGSPVSTTNSQNNPQLLGDYTGTSNVGTGYYNDYTADEVNAINSQLSQTDRLLASLGLTRGVGLTNIANEYTKNVGRAQEGQSQFNRDLNIRRADNQTNKTNSLNRINTDAENKFNSVMRMLGIKGAGVSSAAQMVAPQLISQNASAQRADQFDTFGRNARSVDLAQSDSDLKYKNLFEDLLSQKTQKENDFQTNAINQENDLRSTRATLQAQLAAARGGNTNQAFQDLNGTLARNQITLDDLIRASQTPVYNVKAVDTNAPTLDQYTADPLAVDMQPAEGVDPTDPSQVYLPWLQRKQKLGLQ